MKEMRPTIVGAMPMSIRRKDRKGKADRSSRTSFCSSARDPGPAMDSPTHSFAQARADTPLSGMWRSNQRW